VWAFVGDGEMDEPESLAGLSLAAREGLDNLVFVVNCNLQRLDGPVRGNGSIIQELEGLFAGAGWNVIKLLWGSDWDPLFARDEHGLLLRAFLETVDGEFQSYAATDGASTASTSSPSTRSCSSSSRTCPTTTSTACAAAATTR
jgi:pyruvate dehydrogenase E1 component